MELYFKLNGKEELMFPSVENIKDAFDKITLLILTKSRLFKNTEAPYYRFSHNEKEQKLTVDYGAHNAFYIIKGVSTEAFKRYLTEDLK